jgi:hypothetical protein
MPDATDVGGSVSFCSLIQVGDPYEKYTDDPLGECFCRSLRLR